VIEELARVLNRGITSVRDSIQKLADDWDTLAADGHGWADGYPDPDFLEAWRRHREVYGYTLRSELVYQMLCELRSNPQFSPADRCQVLLVDEYQDLNRCDLGTIRVLAERSGAEVFAVGDDDQSIYSFRHAHPAGIRGFIEDYPAANRYVLVECLRCGPDIVELAKWLIAQEADRIDKDLRSVTAWAAEVHLIRFQDQDAEALGVANIVAAEIVAGAATEEILILLRSDPGGRVSAALARALGNQRVQAYLPRGSGDFDDSVEKLLAYLILSESLSVRNQMDDLALRSLLQLEDNGIGAQRLWAVTHYCLTQGIRFSEAIERFRDNPGEYPSSAVDRLLSACDEIVDRARRLQQAEGEAFDAWLARSCAEVGLEGDSRQAVMSAGAGVIADIEAGATGPAAALSFAVLLAGSMNRLSETLPAKVTGRVTITTMHGAKGLSADVVVVLQAEDEMIPGDAAGTEYDESRRLLYVSLTRARKKLLIGACQRRFGSQRFVGTKEARARTLTRFLRDFGLQAKTAGMYVSEIGG